LIAVTAHLHGCVIPVRAQPGAKRSAILGERNGALRVAVTAAPEKGKANDAVVEVLAEFLGCRRSQIRLLSGVTSREKAFLVKGMTPEEVLQRLSF
jgi:uncharacterized protein (TIGR00251 family)